MDTEKTDYICTRAFLWGNREEKKAHTAVNLFPVTLHVSHMMGKQNILHPTHCNPSHLVHTQHSSVLCKQNALVDGHSCTDSGKIIVLLPQKLVEETLKGSFLEFQKSGFFFFLPSAGCTGDISSQSAYLSQKLLNIHCRCYTCKSFPAKHIHIQYFTPKSFTQYLPLWTCAVQWVSGLQRTLKPSAGHFLGVLQLNSPLMHVQCGSPQTVQLFFPVTWS